MPIIGLVKNIRMNRWKNHAATQLTWTTILLIVPDTMDDMEQVILDTGSVQIESPPALRERRRLIRGETGF